MIDSLIRLLARVCEVVPPFAHLMRRVRFKGRCRIVSAMRKAPFPPELVADCGGLRFALDLRDDVQRAIYFDCYEPRDLDLIRPLVPSGGTCMDVGANVGFYTLHLARGTGSTGRVFSFEPDPGNAERLKRNITLNRFDSFVEVIEAAVSDREGRGTLHRSDAEHSGWGSLVPHATEVSSMEVPTTTLDAFLESRGIPRVDFLKVDVEGSEIELLRGASRALGEHRVRCLFIEFNGVRLAARGLGLGDFLGPLEASGYRPAAVHARLVDRLRRGEVPPHTVWPNLLFEPGA